MFVYSACFQEFSRKAISAYIGLISAAADCQNSNEQTDTKGNPDSLVRVVAHDFIRRPGSGNGLVLQLFVHGFGFVERRLKFCPQLPSSL